MGVGRSFSVKGLNRLREREAAAAATAADPIVLAHASSATIHCAAGLRIVLAAAARRERAILQGGISAVLSCVISKDIREYRQCFRRVRMLQTVNVDAFLSFRVAIEAINHIFDLLHQIARSAHDN